MQDEIAAEHPGLGVVVYGVNMPGYESGQHDMVDGHDIGLLQDTASVDATGAWGAEWRDVVVVDQHNEVVEVYNLGEHDLAEADNYAYLKGLLVETAR